MSLYKNFEHLEIDDYILIFSLSFFFSFNFMFINQISTF